MSGTPKSAYEDGSYLARHPTWHAEDSPWKAEQITIMLRRRGLQPRTICEIGCGAGQVLRCLLGKLPEETRFYGYELAPEAYEMCRRIADQRLTFYRANLLSEDRHFDLVLCIDVVEHVDDYLGFLAALRGKGEYKLFHIPLEVTIERLLRRGDFESARQKYGHLHHFTKNSALSSLRHAGYEVVDWFFTPSELALPPKSAGQRLARLPRKLVWLASKELAARTTGGTSLMVLAR